jgi:hypothetical protein
MISVSAGAGSKPAICTKPDIYILNRQAGF